MTAAFQDIVGIEDGDFKIGDSSASMFELAMYSGPGHFIEDPLYGVDVAKYLNGPPQRLRLERAIRQTLEAGDGWRIDNISYEDNQPIVTAQPPVISVP